LFSDQNRSPKSEVFFGVAVTIPTKNKWLTKMLWYDYEIIYKKRKFNIVDDAFSRKHEEDESLFSLSF
jgi:hypothetical protein